MEYTETMEETPNARIIRSNSSENRSNIKVNETTYIFNENLKRNFMDPCITKH